MTEHNDVVASEDSSTMAGEITRRDFLKVSAVGLAGVGALSLPGKPALAGSSPRSSAVASRSGPKRGGTLKAAFTGGGSSDTLDAHSPFTNMDVARNFALYNSFIVFNDNAQPVLSLAEELTPNGNATKWTLRLKKGITFHNGKEATARDVMFTFNRIMNPKKPAAGASNLKNGTKTFIDVAGMKALDRYTVEIPFIRPFATFDQEIYCNSFDFTLVPVGYNPAKPVGTGPFMFKSFTPGVQSTFVRNPNYFLTGQPYLDELVIVDYADPTSQLNALESGQADVVNLLSADSVVAARSAGAKVVISDSGGINPFTMRVDVPPFDNADLRMAFRLIVNRPQMLESVFSGYGTLANDLTSPYDPDFNHSLPKRNQDIEQAKFLLKRAGHEKGTFTLTTANIAQGIIPAAQVFARQAAEAGITINVNQITVSDFYGKNYTTYPFAQDYLFYYRYLPQAVESFLPGATFNETHWPDAQDAKRYPALYNEAISTLDVAKRRAIVHEMMTIDWNRGSYIIPHYPPIIDGHTSRVHGIVPTKTGLDLSNYGFAQFWVD